MSFTFNGATATINGTVTTSPQKNTIIFATAQRTTAGTTAVVTVTAGKTARIIGMELNGCVTNGNMEARLELNGVVGLRLSLKSTATGQQYGEVGFKGSYNDALVLTATQVINLITDASQVCNATIFYIEE